ncbi:hypothetical protein RHGRI_009057 [Rhododendron griersonianum]|uniref:AB hydrolase-1 domain-containing protein n=1 Tax=Rhododendron griersonianum TaxID=479676 RepID=A0AAV6L2V8_9ERIC|nr:hypothetical protein RHGRI_009057 [Rhododendron griersonianum]
MNARLVGSGSDTVVLAHGYGTDQSVWDKILPDLARHHRVLAFDWIFSGAVKDQDMFDPVKYSSLDAFADDLIALMEEVKPGPSVYINSEGYEGGFDISEVEQLLSSIESDFHSWASSFAPLGVDPNDPPSVTKFQNCLKRMRPETALSVAKLIFLGDQRDMLDKVTVPCTFVQTTNDFVVPNSVPGFMAKKIKGKSTVEVIEADGHFPQLTAHLQLLEVLRDVPGFDL